MAPPKAPRAPQLRTPISDETLSRLVGLRAAGWPTDASVIEAAVEILASLERLAPGKALVLGRTPDGTPSGLLVDTPRGGTVCEDWDVVAVAARKGQLPPTPAQEPAHSQPRRCRTSPSPKEAPLASAETATARRRSTAGKASK